MGSAAQKPALLDEDEDGSALVQRWLGLLEEASRTASSMILGLGLRRYPSVMVVSASLGVC